MTSDSGSAATGKRSFWDSLTGLLTGIAAVLTALAGLIAVLHRSNPTQPPAASETRAADSASLERSTHHRVHQAVDEAPSSPHAMDLSGRWRDLIYGNQIRIRQTGQNIYSETYDALSGRRLAVGQGRISGRRIEGPYVWVTGIRYMAYLTVSADGQEITGTTRNLLTGETLPAHLSR